MIGIEHYLVVSSILFVMGVLGIFLNRKNVIIILMAIELILLSVNINLVAFSAFLGDLVGQVFAMFVLTVAAGEAAIGLAILVRGHRHRYAEIAVPKKRNGKGRVVVVPAWQGKTPFVWKIPGARQSTPMFGGIVIRWAEESETLFVREKVWTVEPSETVRI